MVPAEQAETIVGQYWPLHGPYCPERAEAAATTIAELVRYLNYATGQGARQALPYASHVYNLVGALRAAAGGLDQTLRQLGEHTVELRNDPSLRHVQGRGDRAAALTEAGAAGESLHTAREALAGLYEALTVAQSHLAPLYHHREES